MLNAKDKYNKRINSYSKQLQQMARKSNLLSNLRLLLVIVGIGGTLGLAYLKLYSISYIFLSISFVTFVIVVIRHEQIHTKKDEVELLYRINIDSVQRIKGEWKHFEETGEEFVDENHAFSWDLDLFGKSSLFQWINAANTYIGKQRLKQLLTEPDKEHKSIIRRQEAVKELADKMDWRQQFQAAGMIEKGGVKQPESLFRWAQEQHQFFLKNWVVLLVKILPFVTVGSMIGGFVLSGIPYFLFIIPLILQIVMLTIAFKQTFTILGTIDQYRKDIQIYEKLITLFEQETFHSTYIQQLKQLIKSTKNITVQQQIHKLDKILDRISFRHMQFYMVFNILTLWDYHCVIALEKWKQKYGDNLVNWIECLGEVEALCSLAIIAFEQPEWVMPKLIGEDKICTQQMGHPLIEESTRVCNDLCFGEQESVLLITGSNMSGKSTFLRTLGINLVLAYAGAPVCAKAFLCPVMQIYTSMRVKDNLEHNISSFYAELLRIKVMIEAASRGEKVFFLLDEIFKGTNSRDRHIGAKTLIRKLSRDHTLGLVSTHDLELSVLAEEEKARIKNYHFQEHYKDKQIFFDYRLYPGVSTTFNAIYLMKQVGIEVD